MVGHVHIASLGVGTLGIAVNVLVVSHVCGAPGESQSGGSSQDLLEAFAQVGDCTLVCGRSIFRGGFVYEPCFARERVMVWGLKLTAIWVLSCCLGSLICCFVALNAGV